MKIGLYVGMILAVIAVCLFASQPIFAEEIVVKKAAEIKENCISWEGKVIKFTFYRYDSMKQIAKDRYRANLRGEDREWIYAEFDEEGKRYVKKTKKWYYDDEMGKHIYQTVYARVKIKNSTPYLRLIGRSKDVKWGGEAEYRW